MPDSRYLNRELDEKFGDIKETLSRIEAQTTRTNGRVTRLERWQAYVAGFCGCVTMLVIPVLLEVISNFLHP